MLAALNLGCFVAGYIFIDKDVPPPVQDMSIDWIGASLLSLALVSILFILGQGESAPRKWATPCTLISLVNASQSHIHG
jgi:hypothetical protein